MAALSQSGPKHSNPIGASGVYLQADIVNMTLNLCHIGRSGSANKRNIVLHLKTKDNTLAS